MAAPTEEAVCPRCERGRLIDYLPGVAACSWCGVEKHEPTPSDQGVSSNETGGPQRPSGVTKKRAQTPAQRVAKHRQRKREAAVKAALK